jgi:hypothetical protein
MDSLEYAKMRFIYNAILNGWTVRKLDDGRFEFVKELQKITTDVNATTFLQDVFQRWMSIDAGINRS